MTACRVIALLAFIAPLAAHAQQNAPPEPIVRTTIDPPRVTVGQPTTLRLEVLAPNYMTSPPELPGFQIRNAVTRQLQSVNTNEQQNGIQYAGVRFEFAIYPLEAGSFAVAGQKLTIRYAAEPPATREAVVSLPRIEFQAFVPDAAAALHPFVAATSLTIEQAIQRSSGQLKTGDAVTRVVTMKAEGAPAMLLPPQQFATIDGLRLYRAQPALDDKIDGRTDILTASRVNSATYMLERAGNYTLPAMDIGWWNISRGKLEQVHLDAVPLNVAVDPTAGRMAPAGGLAKDWSWDAIVGVIADHWVVALLLLVLLAGLGWLAPAVVRRSIDLRHRRQRAYLQSEAFAFSRFRHAVYRRDAEAAYFALLNWLPHLDATAPVHSLDTFKAAAKDAALNREIGLIETGLFANGRGAVGWSPHQLLRRVSVSRGHLRTRATRRDSASLPRQLNPVSSTTPAVRKPAR